MRYLVQDIETIPESEIAASWEPTEAELEKAKPNEPFPPIWVHKIACIGMLGLDGGLRPVKGRCAAGGLAGGKSEKEMLEKWSAIAGGASSNGSALKLVDWHGRGFDVPVLQTRCFRYGIQLPWYFGKLPDNRGQISSYSRDYRDRYKGWHIDLADAWTNHGSFYKPNLSNLAELMGLPGKFGMDGSMVHDAYKEGRLAEIDAYCMQDVFETAFIFQRWKLLKGSIGLEAYREAATALLDWIEKLPEQKAFFEAIDRPALLLESE